MRVSATTGDVLFGFTPGEWLFTRSPAIDGHREVAIGKHIVQRPLTIIDGRNTFRYLEICVIPSKGRMADHVAQFERRQSERGVVCHWG